MTPVVALHPARAHRARDPLHELAAGAMRLSHDVVDVAGFLDGVDAATTAQARDLGRARTAAQDLAQAGQTMARASDRVDAAVREMADVTGQSAERLHGALGSSQAVLEWVSASESRMTRLSDIVGRVRQSNAQVTDISREVNMLAINARIEAARAGDAGRGFVVVADAIKALSRQTTVAATSIADTVRKLAEELAVLTQESATVASRARQGLGLLDEAGQALGRMDGTAQDARQTTAEIVAQVDAVRRALDSFGPALAAVLDNVAQVGGQVHDARERIGGLIGVGERMVQDSVALGGATEDAPLIDAVKARAAQLGRLLEGAVAAGEITAAALFDTRYVPVPGSDPPQVMAPFTDLTDRLFPPVQEEALGLDPRIVFCAAVDRNGYLPTHNRRFSAPQGADPVWNAAHCRNRRIFDDRVGLGAGRSTAPFLLQVYRRDMGGGQFAMMKDVSAPIFVKGRHWGGLRLAWRF
ncbi:MAG TPA: methyl-accepting chemotaxis protein [Paracoccaceae bacterium]|nr:methyl-accepting chemotaxis protein [Paracoccaceae bacterium]